MKYWKVVAVSLLFAVPCVLLAWGAAAIGQSAGIAVTTEATPAQGPQPPVVTTTETNIFRGSGGGASGSGWAGAWLGGAPENAARSYSVSISAAQTDPLKDVTDLGKASDDQLQQGDGYLEAKTRDLAQQYAQAKGAEAQAKLKTELTQTIEKHFDVRHEIRKREIDQLEARVKQLREHLQKREAARRTIVDMRLGQFLSAAEGLGWDTDLGGSRYPPRGRYDGPSPYGRNPYSPLVLPSQNAPSTGAGAPASTPAVRRKTIIRKQVTPAPDEPSNPGESEP
jgi:hypothetical protein